MIKYCSVSVSYTHLDVYKRQFLGLCNYYRKFQRNYSEMTAKFSPQLSSKNKWSWGQEQDNLLQMIKHNFLSSVVLKHPNFNQPFFMNCDASDISLGSVLYQEDSTN